MAQPKKLYLEAVQARDELSPLTKPPIDRVQLARYAGAAGDFNPMTVDEASARAAGLPSVHAPGLLALGFLGQLVGDWARGGRVIRLGARFLKLIWPGDVVSAKGFVRERKGENGKYTAELDLSCENQKGERLLRGWATVQLFFNAEDEARQRRGEPPLIVQVRDDEEVAKPKKGKPAPAARPAARPAATAKKTAHRAAARSSKRPRPEHKRVKAKPAKAKRR